MQEGALHDRYEETLQPLLHLKPLFLLRDGIFTPLERARLAGKVPAEIPSARSPAEFSALCSLHECGALNPVFTGEQTTPAKLLASLGARVTADIHLLGNEFTTSPVATVEGPRDQLFAHPSAVISRHAVIDTTDGPVIIAQEAQIAAFSYVKGPAYVGPQTRLDQCRFTNSIAGQNCRLGGEIADSIFGDFSNKHHDGFVGHSLVGDWVNLGALTTTSDLKNNYGEVRLQTPTGQFSTGTIKFGSVIGDYVKTAIGTLLGTGTIIGFGANLFGKAHWSGYISPFTWGENGVYDREFFRRDALRMMQRRGKQLKPLCETLIGKI